ncbi:dipeptidase PepV, partial [Escherichia coli]|nr:dipeptidase PepV [Escherichia coli]
LGFVPDAEFPILHAEKGISELDVSFKDGEASGEAAFRLLSVESGERYNMVPDHATAILEDVKDFDKVASAFKTFLANHPVEGT